MKKSSKKLIAALLSAAMVFSVTACGDTETSKTSENTVKSSEESNTQTTSEVEEKLYYNEEGFPICDETITIKVSGVQGNSPDWNNTLFVKTVEEKLGIKMECEPIASDAWKTQYALMLSTGELPDLIINGGNMDKAQIDKDGEAGFWLDISQYLDIMPNFKAMMEEYPQWAAYTQTEKGAIYGINRISASKSLLAVASIRAKESLLEGAGVDPNGIKTVDDFYNALVAVKAKYPDMIPLSFTPDKMPAYGVDIILRTAFGVNYNDNSYMLVADDAGKVSLADISDNNREYLKFMNKLYDEKLLDNNAFITTKDEYRANNKAGKYVFMWDAGGAGNFAVNGETDADFITIRALSSEYTNNETNYNFGSEILAGARIFVNAKTEYPEAICRLIDYMASEEGLMLCTYGVEGETYDLVYDEVGLPSVDHTKYADLTNYKSVSEWLGNKVVIDQAMNLKWSFMGGVVDDLSKEELTKIASSNSTYAVNAQRLLELAEIDNLHYGIPALAYTEEEAKERATLRTDILNYFKQMKVSFMSGEVDVNDDKAWNAYIDQVKSMGYDRLMQIEQAAYDRYAAGLK